MHCKNLFKSNINFSNSAHCSNTLLFKFVALTLQCGNCPKTTQRYTWQPWASLSVAGHAWTFSTKSISLRCYFSSLNIYLTKIKNIHAYFPINDKTILESNWYFGLKHVKQNCRIPRSGISTRKQWFNLFSVKNNDKTL